MTSSLDAFLQSALGSDYRVEEELDGGGMSRVFMALDLRHDRRVVVKVLSPEFVSPTSTARFKREIALTIKLQHPHILPVLTSGTHDDVLYYITPFIAGESLRARIKREGKLPLRDVMQILRDASDALAFAHARGVVHRDIKPGNILLAEGHAVLADFGIARAVSTQATPLTASGMMPGTPAYMAPELPTDQSADVFSLGIVGYEMLCGTLPQRAVTPEAVVAARGRVTEDSRPCLAALAALIAKSTSHSAAQRPASVAKFAEALAPLVAGQQRVTRSTLLVPVGAATLLILAALAYIATTRHSVGASPSTDPAMRLTSEAGYQGEPALSPDGRFVAYVDRSSGRSDIFVQSVEGTHASKVAIAPGIRASQPAWTPDGRNLVYRSEEAGGEIWTVPAFGGSGHRVVGNGYAPEVSSDGSRLLVVSSQLDVTARPGVRVASYPDGLTQSIVHPAVLEPFRAMWSVHWLPGNGSIAFAGRLKATGWDIYTLALVSGTLRKIELPESLRNQLIAVERFVVSGSGRFLFLQGTTNSMVTSVWRLPVNRDLQLTGPPSLVSSGLQDLDITTSADGGIVAFTRTSEQNKLWKLTIDSAFSTAAPTTPLSSGSVDALLQACSIDHRIAYIGFVTGQDIQQLRMLDAPSGRDSLVRADGYRRLALRWAPDGVRLAYRRSEFQNGRRSARHELVLFSTKTSEETTLIAAPNVEKSGVWDIPYDWSKDGRSLIVGHSDGEETSVWRYDLSSDGNHVDHKIRLAARRGYDLWQAQVSPDSRWLAFVAAPRDTAGRSSLHVISSSGMQQHETSAAPNGSEWVDKPRWNGSGDRLCYLSNAYRGIPNVWCRTFDVIDGQFSGEPRRLTDFDGVSRAISPHIASVEMCLRDREVVLPLREANASVWSIRIHDLR